VASNGSGRVPRRQVMITAAAASSLLLDGALAALGPGLALLVTALVPHASRQRGVGGALAVIEHHYARRAAAPSQRGGQPTALPGWLRWLGLRLSPSGVGARLQRKLDLAGNPRGWTADRILAVKGLGLVALGGIGGLYGLHGVATFIGFALVGGAAGFFLPDLLLHNAALKRQQRVQQGLPDALDMLTVCVEAGLGFDSALAQVARNTRGPIAEEFTRALQEMQIGAPRGQALRGMVARTTVPELRVFVSALIQANDLGVPVAQVLRQQASEMRVRRRQRAEEKAQKVTVKILFPLIFCLFPALFVVILGPGIIEAMRILFGK
jgi:tight adherence protein C